MKSCFDALDIGSQICYKFFGCRYNFPEWKCPSKCAYSTVSLKHFMSFEDFPTSMIHFDIDQFKHSIWPLNEEGIIEIQQENHNRY